MTLYALQESTWSYMSGSSHFAGIRKKVSEIRVRGLLGFVGWYRHGDGEEKKK